METTRSDLINLSHSPLFFLLSVNSRGVRWGHDKEKNGDFIRPLMSFMLKEIKSL